MSLAPPSCLLHVSVSPLSEGELLKVKTAFQQLDIRAQWLNVRERQTFFLLELRTELAHPVGEEAALAERIARGIWNAIGRFVRVVFVFPNLETWPGGLEFGERDYTRIMRSRS